MLDPAILAAQIGRVLDDATIPELPKHYRGKVRDNYDLADGRRISGRADFGKGSPANPMTDDELAGKFRECAAWGKASKANAEKIIDRVFNMEKLKSIRELTKLLSR